VGRVDLAEGRVDQAAGNQEPKHVGKTVSDCAKKGW
jgi:hypothetical protein